MGETGDIGSSVDATGSCAQEGYDIRWEDTGDNTRGEIGGRGGRGI